MVVQEKRKKAVENLLNMQPLRLIRSAKGCKEVNLTLFYRRFPIFSALSQLYELKFDQKDQFFQEGVLKAI